MGNKTSQQLISDENMKVYLGLTYLDRFEIERYKRIFDEMLADRPYDDQIDEMMLKEKIEPLRHNPFCDRIFKTFTRHRISVMSEAGPVEMDQHEGFTENSTSNNNTNNSVPLSNNLQGHPTHSNPGTRTNLNQNIKNKTYMKFEDFLDLMSVFSERCPAEIKAYYAFHIYDFDEDGFINKRDIAEMVKRLTGVDDEAFYRQQRRLLNNQNAEQNENDEVIVMTRESIANFSAPNPNPNPNTTSNLPNQPLDLAEQTRRQAIHNETQKGNINYDQYGDENAYYKQNEMNDPLKFIDEIANAIMKEASCEADETNDSSNGNRLTNGPNSFMMGGRSTSTNLNSFAHRSVSKRSMKQLEMDGISQVEFQRILLNNPEFKSHFTFKMI